MGFEEELALELLLELASPHIVIDDTGNTRDELTAAVRIAIRGLTRSAYGPVIRALLSHIAVDPSLGDPFRATVVKARRAEIAAVVAARRRGRRTERCQRRRRDGTPHRSRVLPVDVWGEARPQVRRECGRHIAARLCDDPLITCGEVLPSRGVRRREWDDLAVDHVGRNIFERAALVECLCHEHGHCRVGGDARGGHDDLPRSIDLARPALT